jgi:arylsulfatase
MSSERLNILLVVLEGARPDHLSHAGYERDTTPFLDQVAREGVRFTHAFTAAPERAAGVASLLTGLLPSLHGVSEEAPVLAPGVRVLPEVLKAAGYRTAAFCPDPALDPEAGFGRGFDRYYTQRVGGRITGRAADYARRASDRVLGRGDAGARRSTQALIEWLSGSTDPFFAFLHYREPLRPIRPPAPYDRAFMPPSLTSVQARQVNVEADGRPRPVAADEAAALAALHDGALRYADLRLKEIADWLAAAGRWEQTLLIVTASCGEDLGDGGTIGGPPSLHDTGLHVPLVLRCPNRIPSGFAVQELAQSVDLMPTVAALAGCEIDAAVQGRALLTASGATAGPTAVVAEAFRGPLTNVRRKAIGTRREKFIWRSDEANELYDLTRDPDERHNLAESESERADRLRRLLFDRLADGQRWAAEHAVPIVEPRQRPALERQGARE